MRFEDGALGRGHDVNSRKNAEGLASADLEKLRRLAELMDRRFLDPILGLLLPGLGDTLGSLIGLYGVVVAWRARVHPVVLSRMLLNLGVDALLGAFPVLGVVFDFFYRAHLRNYQLLFERAPSGDPTAKDYWIVFGALALLFFFSVVVPLVVLVGIIAFVKTLL